MRFARYTMHRLAGLLLLASSSTLVAQSSYEEWVAKANRACADHLRLGLRIQTIKLTDGERTPRDSSGNGQIDGEEILDVSYLGSITSLPLESEFAVAPYAQWFFNDYFGLELSWDRYAAEAQTYYNQDTGWDGHVDGVLSVSGPSLIGLFAYPNQSRITPQLGAGLAWLMLDFDMDEGFHNGGGDYRRTIEPTDDSMLAWVVQAVVEFSYTENIKFDAYFRHLEAEVDMLFYLSHGGVIDRGYPVKAVFPMSSNMFGIGLKYAF
jgi:hypothetical protein